MNIFIKDFSIDLDKASNWLNSTEKTILTKYVIEQYTLKEIGKMLKLKSERVRIIKDNAILKLYNLLSEYDSRDRNCNYHSPDTWVIDQTFISKGHTLFSTHHYDYQLKKGKDGNYSLFNITTGEYVEDNRLKRKLIRHMYYYCTGKRFE